MANLINEGMVRLKPALGPSGPPGGPAAEVSLTGANLTECIAFGPEGDDAPLIPVVNSLGWRPQGPTLAASRKHKEVKEAPKDSAVKARFERKAAGGVRASPRGR